MRKKVLIVDDEKEIVDFLETFLERFDISVIKATGGNQAVSLYQIHNPDGIFLDIQMPDRDGISVLMELKKINRNVKVIMITGKEEKAFQEKAKLHGAVDYVTKPLDLSELSKKIKEHFSPEPGSLE